MFRQILKNTSYLAFAIICQKILVFFYFIFLARFLGAADFGKYNFAFAFSLIFVIITALGFEHVITREIAKKKDLSLMKEESQKYLGSVLFFKIWLSLLMFLCVFIAINLLNYPSETKIIVYLISLAVIVESFTTVFYAVFRAFQNLKYEAIGFFGSYVLICGIGTWALFLGYKLIPIATIYLLGNLLNFLFAFYFICKKFGFPKFVFEKKLAKFLLFSTLPFAFSGIFIKVYDSIDTVMLSKLKGDEIVGFYNAAFKLIFSLQFIPVVFMASIYPLMSTLFMTSLEKLEKVFSKTFKYLLLISLPISFGISVLADKIILLMYKEEYLGAIPALMILAFMTIFVFLNFVTGTLLNAINKQKTNMYIDACGMILNISLNCFLIPLFSLSGAAFASVITISFLLFLRMQRIKKFLKFNFSCLFKDAFKIIFSAFLISLFLFFFKNFIPLIFLIFLAIFFYFLILFLIKGFDKEDLKMIKNP